MVNGLPPTAFPTEKDDGLVRVEKPEGCLPGLSDQLLSPAFRLRSHTISFLFECISN